MRILSLHRGSFFWAALLFWGCGPVRGFTDTGFRPLEDVVLPDRVVIDTPADLSVDAPSTDSNTNDALDAAIIDAADSAVEIATDAPIDVATEAAPDVLAQDTAAEAASDAGPGARCPTVPTIDGMIGTDWASSVPRIENTVPSAWNPMLNELRSLRACHDGEQLYLALEGITETGSNRNALLVYLDRDFGRASGLANLSLLADRSGALDVAATVPFTFTGSAADFSPEGVWGSVGMSSLEATQTNEAVGLRLFFPSGGAPDRRNDFAWIQGTQTRCSSTARACEVAISLRALFERPAPQTLPLPTTIALFARLVSAQGARVSNQTLPQDNPDMPLQVARILTIDVR